MFRHVLTIRGGTAAADGVTWAIDPQALTQASGEDLFRALFPRGPAHKWYKRLPSTDPLYVDADAALESVAWETMDDGDCPLSLTRGVVRVVPGSMADTLMNLGAAMEALDRPEEAVAHYEQAIGLFEEAGDEEGLMEALLQLATYLEELECFEDAAECYGRAAEAAGRIGDRATEAYALDALASACEAQDMPLQAEQHYRRAADIYLQIGDRAGQSESMANLGHMLLNGGRALEASEVLQQSLAIGREGGFVIPQVTATCGIARLHQLAGDPDAALEAIRGALQIGVNEEADAVLYATGTALDMAAAAVPDWDLVTRLADGLGGIAEGHASKPTASESMDRAVATAAVAFSVMAAVAKAKGNASHPILSLAPRVVEQVDEASGYAFGLTAWFDEVCGRASGGGLP